VNLGLKTLPRGERVLLAGVGLLVCFAGTFIHAGIAAGRAEPGVAANRALASSLALTDLALFTEARYTRHRSQADLHAAFQDHPGALEHFPTGSLAGPPPYRAPYAEQPVAPEAAVPR
jgi:F0F1-type ATP synthase membrane subunit c/vacuolar-type H+-ATPase subunit K